MLKHSQVALTLSDWQAALPELRRHGQEWRGPCPMSDCGGECRFHVSAKGVVGSRGCIEGLRDAERVRRFGEQVREVFGEAPLSNGHVNGTTRHLKKTCTCCRPDGTGYHRVYRRPDAAKGKRIRQDPGFRGRSTPTGSRICGTGATGP